LMSGAFAMRLHSTFCENIKSCFKHPFTPPRLGTRVPVMAAEFDATEFIDEDLERSRRNPLPTPASMNADPDEPPRAPTREEVDSKLVELQGKLAELKQEQDQIERERAAFEETRRRQMEFTTGREELIRDLSRGIQLLEEKEFAIRREAEQMARALGELRDSLAKLQAIQQENWTKETFNADLSRALGVADHARMEWNSARLKFSVLSASTVGGSDGGPAQATKPARPLEERSFLELARLGFALTWPIALAGLAIVVTLLVRR
jgi:hypothetical protein